MRIILNFAALLALTLAAAGQEIVARFDWAAATNPPRGTVPSRIDNRDALKIESTNDAGLQIALLTVDKPRISTTMYSLQGEVRYDSVQGDGFIEMWNYFPAATPGQPEGEFFSRTLGDSGELGKISGTSDWRPFSLPFNSAGATGSPTKLQINLVLRGRGTVYLGPLTLVQYPAAKTDARAWWLPGPTPPNAWWSNRAGGLGGGIGGAVLGCLGALIGVLAGVGRCRGLVLALFKMQILLGGVLAAAAVAALTQRQPYCVWYPLALTGILLLAIYPPMLSKIKKQYQERELRRIQSLDALG
jgi:hypothetical protein